jgi:hypothetical protein
MQRPYRKLPTMSAGVFCALLLCVAPSANLNAQNGITAAQVTGTTTGAGSGIDAMWADGNDKRWKMNNNNTGAQDVAAWACPSELGGILYAGAAVSGVDAESCLSLSGTVGVPLLAGSGTPQWGGSSTYLDLQQNALVTEFTNSTSGTTAGLLVILITSSGSSQVETALTSTTQGVEGICAGGCGMSGTAQIAREGIASCQFDGSTTAGDYVQISTTAGKCHDTSTYPTNGNQLIGRVITNQSGSGTYAMLLYADGIIPPAQGTCTNQVVTATNNASGPTCTTVTSAYVDSSIAGTGSPTFSGTVDLSGTTTKLPKVSGSSYATGAEQISVGSSGASNAAIGDGTNARVVPYVLYKGIKFSATGNVTSYTDLLSSPTSSAGSLTLVANQLLVGSVIHGKLAATVTVGTAGNLNFEVKLGGTVINSPVTLNTPPASTTVFTLEFWAFVTATGTSGSVTTSSDGHTGGTATSFIQIDQDGSTATVNTTGTLAIDVVGEFGTSNASNTMQVMFAEMDLY